MQPSCATGPFELEQIVDGFSYDLNLRFLPERYRASAVKQLEFLRRANNYRPRMYVVPDPFNVPIQPYLTQEYQFRVTPGSLIWAVLANAYDPSSHYAQVSAKDLLVQVTDSCTGVKFFSDFTTAATFQAPQMRAAADTNFGVEPFILTEPRLIGDPGHINVEISNALGVAQYIQFTLFSAEPCEVIHD